MNMAERSRPTMHRVGVVTPNVGACVLSSTRHSASGVPRIAQHTPSIVCTWNSNILVRATVVPGAKRNATEIGPGSSIQSITVRRLSSTVTCRCALPHRGNPLWDAYASVSEHLAPATVARLPTLNEPNTSDEFSSATARQLCAREDRS